MIVEGRFFELYILYNVIQNFKKAGYIRTHTIEEVKDIQYQIKKKLLTTAARGLSGSENKSMLEKTMIKTLLYKNVIINEKIKSLPVKQKRVDMMINRYRDIRDTKNEITENEVDIFSTVVLLYLENSMTSSDFEFFVNSDGFKESIKEAFLTKFKQKVSKGTDIELLQTKIIARQVNESLNVDFGIDMKENIRYFRYSLYIFNELKYAKRWEFMSWVYLLSTIFTLILFCNIISDSIISTKVAEQIVSGSLEIASGQGLVSIDDVRRYKSMLFLQNGQNELFERLSEQFQDGNTTSFFITSSYIGSNWISNKYAPRIQDELDDSTLLKSHLSIKAEKSMTLDFEVLEFLAEVPLRDRKVFVKPAKTRATFIKQQMFAPYVFNKNLLDSQDTAIVTIANRMEIVFQKTYKQAHKSAELFNTDQRFGVYKNIIDANLQQLSGQNKLHDSIKNLRTSYFLFLMEHMLVCSSVYSGYASDELDQLRAMFVLIDNSAYNTYTEEIEARKNIFEKTLMFKTFVFMTWTVSAQLSKYITDRSRRGKEIRNAEISKEMLVKSRYNFARENIANNYDSNRQKFVNIFKKLFELTDQHNKLEIYAVFCMYHTFVSLDKVSVQAFIHTIDKLSESLVRKNARVDLNVVLSQQSSGDWISLSLDKKNTTYRIYRKFFALVIQKGATTPEKIFQLFFKFSKTSFGYKFSKSTALLVNRKFGKDISKLPDSEFNRSYNALSNKYNPFETFSWLMKEVCSGVYKVKINRDNLERRRLRNDNIGNGLDLD